MHLQLGNSRADENLAREGLLLDVFGSSAGQRGEADQLVAVQKPANQPDRQGARLTELGVVEERRRHFKRGARKPRQISN